MSVEDLLPRQQIRVDLKSVGEQLHGKKVLITGSAGSIGAEIVRQVASFGPAKMMLIDQAETPQHDIRLMMAKDFPDIDAVPKQAVSMTVKQILKAKCIVSITPHTVKAEAIYNTLTKPLTNRIPATALKTHPDWNLFIDYDSAKLIYDSTNL